MTQPEPAATYCCYGEGCETCRPDVADVPPQHPRRNRRDECHGYEWRGKVPWKCHLPPGHKAPDGTFLGRPCKGNDPTPRACPVGCKCACCEAGTCDCA